MEISFAAGMAVDDWERGLKNADRTQACCNADALRRMGRDEVSVAWDIPSPGIFNDWN
jgi:hypothetical protein